MQNLKTYTGSPVLIQFLLLFSLHAAGQFQPSVVVRSQEKTIINGRIFFIHTIQKGQTLYSISKAYEVTQEDILKENPEIDAQSLREGLAIRIPQSTQKEAAIYPQNQEDFYAHRVRRGQTVYSLARKYDVDQELIYRYNPWARQGIQPDQTIWIPRRKELQSIEADNATQAGFYYHTVKEQETLYGISMIYGVSVSDIVGTNPFLRDGLKAGQVLSIPKFQTPGTQEIPEKDSLADIPPCHDISQEKVTYKVALLLPFFAAYSTEETLVAADTLAEEGTYVPVQRQHGMRGRNFAEFYEGFLLAIDSMRKTGFSVSLHVFDTERDTLKVKKIMRDLSLIQPDLVIGPVYTQDVHIAGHLARNQDFNLISPLSTKTALISGNTRIFQVVPSREAECKSMAAYLSRLRTGKIILIRGTDSIAQRDSWLFKKYLTEHMPVDSNDHPLVMHDYRLDDSLLDQMEQVLSQQEENIVVIFSESEPDVSRLVSRLYMVSALYPIKLFGLPSWQIWKTIDLSYFHSLQLHLISPFFTDYSHPSVKRFLYKCRMEYGYEPYEIHSRGYNFSMLGYDLGFYFLSALRKYGRDFQDCISQVSVSQLLAPYHFVKSEDGGYINTGFNMIRYNPDFTITNSYVEGVW